MGFNTHSYSYKSIRSRIRIRMQILTPAAKELRSLLHMPPPREGTAPISQVAIPRLVIKWI